MADQPKIIISAVDNTRTAFNSVKTGLGQIEGVGSTLNGVIGRLAPVLGAATFTAFVKGGIDTLDMLGDLSDRTDVAASTLSGFQLVAAQSDTSLEALGKGLNKLSVYMAENGEAAAKLGITAKDPAEAFIQLSEVISGVEDTQQRAALANKILGKSYQELLPALLQGGDALRAQIEAGKELTGVTDENVKKAQEFNDKLDLLKTKASNAGVGIASDLLPSLNEITTNFIENNKKAGLFLATLAAIGNITKIVAVGADQENLEQRQLELLERIGIAEKRNAETSEQGNKTARENARRNLINMRKELAEVTAQLEANYAKDHPIDKKTAGNAVDIKDIINPKSKSKSSKNTADVAKEAATEYSKLYGEFTKIIDGTNQLTQAEQTLRDIQAGKFADLLPWQQQQLAGLAEQVRLQSDMAIFAEGENRATETQIELENQQFEDQQKFEQQQQSAMELHDKILADINAESEELEFQLSIQGLSQKAQDEKIAARNVEIQLQQTLNELAEAGLGLSEEEIIALREKYTELSTLNSKIKENKTTGSELGLTFKSAFEDAIVKGEDLGDVIDSLGEDIMRIATRRMFTDPLMGAVDSFLGSFDFSAFIPGITANADGGVYSSPSLSAYSGSVVSQPTMFAFANGAGLMGEAGAEGIFPLKRGKDGKLGVSVSGSGNSAPNVIINLIESAGNGGQVNQKQDGNNLTIDVMVEKIESTIGRNISQGRGIAPVMERQYGLNRAAGAY